jgi:hypothetical protein
MLLVGQVERLTVAPLPVLLAERQALLVLPASPIRAVVRVAAVAERVLRA